MGAVENNVLVLFANPHKFYDSSYSYFHFVEEEMESQRNKAIHPRSSSWGVAEPGMNPSIMNS